MKKARTKKKEEMHNRLTLVSNKLSGCLSKKSRDPKNLQFRTYTRLRGLLFACIASLLFFGAKVFDNDAKSRELNICIFVYSTRCNPIFLSISTYITSHLLDIFFASCMLYRREISHKEEYTHTPHSITKFTGYSSRLK